VNLLLEFQNPVLPGFYPDPSVCRVGEDYFLATSTFEYFPGVPIFHSRDLVNWRQIGNALTRTSQLDLRGVESSKGIFAPTLRHHCGTFFLVTTNITKGGNFFVTAQDPAGRWSEPVWLNDPTGMDPSLLFDVDGRVYYTRHGGGERGGVYQTEVTVDDGKLQGEPRLIWSGTGGVWPEGPHLYAIEGRYYLMIAEGGTGTQHSITIARSTSPYGPFESNPNNPILTHRHDPTQSIQATGHGDLVQSADGRWWLVFLGTRPSAGGHHHLGRETFLAPVHWEDGWPIVNQNAPVGERVSSTVAVTRRAGASALERTSESSAAPARDDFDAPVLGPHYVFLRNPSDEDRSLSARPGSLRLYGNRHGLNDLAAPAFVGRRQQHFEVCARTMLKFEPTALGHEAGLVVRANERNHYDLSITRTARGKRVQLRAVVNGSPQLLAERAAPVGSLILVIRAHRLRYDFAIIRDPDRAQEEAHLGSASTQPVSSESAGGFTGVVLAMFAHAPAGVGEPADFEWFELLPP
jgi:alpha-N-arabinofuranosidase